MCNGNVNPDNAAKVATDGVVQVPHDVTHTTLQVLAIGILIGAVAWIIRPFITSITWAGMIVADLELLEMRVTYIISQRSLNASIPR